MERGPNLQQDLQALILRWRRFPFVYTADIETFYREVRIQEQDQHLQRILWRDSEEDKIKEYQPCTVTYGTKAAPFLAMRTIKQLIYDDGAQYPLAAEILQSQLYVDDLLAGSYDLQQAKATQQQLIDLLKQGGFNLRKWASNDKRLLEDLKPDQISQNMIDFKHTETNKTLGVMWNPSTDQFTFHHPVEITNECTTITKRSLLSQLSKRYDPLGWLSPATIKAKLIFQQLWTTNLNWDDPVPQNVQKQ
ncbi:uncharacterized protein LOC113507526 [Trichoplusia ni]|uniref:Uncharacterized protein LOC113507526 n=1 Tax=Trichoplusia ni TaxID=7111 RepID=A0A7E5WZ77_TRINI|nr:uncharacterized protein LOC113507526 [Trichoplusia ni]